MSRAMSTRSSLPPPARGGQPSQTRGANSYRHSAAFPFSMARPPTDYTTGTVVRSPVPTLPSRGRDQGQVPMSVRATDSWIPFTAHRRGDSTFSVRSDTELLRSAGAGPQVPGGETPTASNWPRSATAYSASSWQGPRTGTTPFEPVEEDWESALAPDRIEGVRQMEKTQDPNITVRTDPSTLHRLGPMTPATPRYSFQGRPSSRHTDDPVDPIVGVSKLTEHYHTLTPFSRALIGLIAAVLLTCVIHSLDSGLASIADVKGGVLPVSAAGGADVQLGVSGWCAGGTCRGYIDQDFASSNGEVKIPGSQRLTTLGNLLSAHLCLLWLQASFHLVTCFLHFFLLSSLSLPLSYLSSFPSDERAQAEVELQVRCYRPPNEGMGWVWWAWWAHRRGPVGPLFGFVNDVLAIATLGAIIAFVNQMKSVAKEGGVALGTGAILVIVVTILNGETTVSSLIYWLHRPTYKLSLFSNPPDPTPAALFLPNNGSQGGSKPLVEDRGSFFPVRETQAFPSHTPRASLAIDAETKRWLSAYPSDPELVPLISSLRSGHPNDDFLLSDIGLLYLRAEEGALLVPPKGEIRMELVQDAHFEVEEHLDSAEMLSSLQQTFWWSGIEADVEEFVSRCRGCVERRVFEAQLTAGQPVPITAASERIEAAIAGARAAKRESEL